MALPLYAQAFEAEGALDKLEAFASNNGPTFYGLPLNEDSVTLVREAWTVPRTYKFGDTVVVPLCAGQEVSWKVQEGWENRT